MYDHERQTQKLERDKSKIFDKSDAFPDEKLNWTKNLGNKR